jgi:hypothetical protein
MFSCILTILSCLFHYILLTLTTVNRNRGSRRKKTTTSRSPRKEDGAAPRPSRSRAGKQRGSPLGKNAASPDTTPQHHCRSLTGLGGEAMEKEGSSAPERTLIKVADFTGRGSAHGVSRFPREPTRATRRCPKSHVRSHVRPSP